MRLRQAFVVAVILACASLAGAQTSPYRLEIPEIGVRLDLPRGWHWQASQAVAENRARVRFADPGVAEAIRDPRRLPRASLTRHPVDYAGGVNPTINVAVRALSGRAPTPSQALEASIRLMRTQMQAFRIVEPVRAVTLGGQPAATARVRFTMATEDGRTFEVENRSVQWVARGHAVTLAMSGPAEGPDRSDHELDAVVASIAPLGE